MIGLNLPRQNVPTGILASFIGIFLKYLAPLLFVEKKEVVRS